MYKIYVSDHIFENFNQEREALKDIDCEIIPLQCKTTEELKLQAKDADALLNTYLPGINGEVMDAMPNLKVIVRYGIGYNTIDVGAASVRGIQVANVPDYCLDEVSDHAVALMLDVVRKTTMSNNRIKKDGDYSLGYLKPILPLKDAKVGIIGFGRIGVLIAQKLFAFGCNIRFYDPYVPGDRQFENFTAYKASLDKIYENSDIIMLQAPATKENYHMLDSGSFNKMKRRPYIVNCARGELINEEALIHALKIGQILGAGLDVLESIPPVSLENELLQFENVVLTPHSAWVSAASSAKLQYLAAMEVARVLKGGVVKSLINPEYIK
jgi:D-3-phosphoglycerate dehydrogenase